MSKKKAKVSLQNSMSLYDNISVITLIVASALVPLLVYLQKVDLSGVLKQYWTGEEFHYDLFSKIKSDFLIICGAILLIYWIYKMSKGYKFELSVMFVPMFIYCLMVILSSISSKYSQVALFGFVDRCEGLFVILSYILIFFTASILIKDDKITTRVINIIFVSSIIMAILGLTQFYNVDLLQTDLGKRLILANAYEILAPTLQFNFPNAMYTTVYNPNYLGSYSVLLLPIAISLYYNNINANKKKAVFMLITACSVFILWLGGLSRAGLLGGVLMLPLLIFFLRKRIIRYWKSSVLLLVLLVSIYLVMDLTSGGSLTREFKNTLPSSLVSNTSSSKSEAKSQTNTNTPSKVVDVKLNNNVLTFQTTTEKLVMELQDNSLKMTDESGKNIIPLVNGNVVTLDDDRYKLYSVDIEQNVAIMKYGNATIPFIFLDGKMEFAPTKFLYFDTVGAIPSLGFKNAEAFASGRGFIWSRSIPLIKDSLILGHGPDTFPIYFPQQDIAGKINGLNDATVIVDKPHNWYLQNAINTGLISLIAILVFLIWFILKGILKWKADDGSNNFIIGSAIVCAIIGYCVAAFFNDSNVAVAPVFWIILGIGVSQLAIKQKV